MPLFETRLAPQLRISTSESLRIIYIAKLNLIQAE